MKNLLIAFILILATATSSRACDTCGCEICDPGVLNGVLNGIQGYSSGPGLQQSYFFASVAEQYTDYSHIINVPVGASLNQFERSAITQFILGYQINDRLGVQVNVPYIYRWYRVMNNAGTAMDSGQSDGLGDVSVVANYVVLRDQQGDWGYTWRVAGGLKLPTGDSGLLALEAPGTSLVSPLNGAFSAIGGHDVALGSGSYDGILSTGVSVNRQRWFMTADADYAIRGTGSFGYRYANEFSGSAGPGYRLIDNANYALSLQMLVTGEYKGADTIQGTVTNDTAGKSVSLGPKVLFTWNQHFTAHLALELPVAEHYDPGFQALPTYRLKAGLTFRF